MAEITFFRAPAEFHKWLSKHHPSETELTLGFYKVSSVKKGVTYAEALDEALAFGWIDGVRKNLDADSYTIRFTPRKPSSIWSNVNIKKVEELIKQKRMQPSGMAAYEKRDAKKTGIYAFENKEKGLSPEYEKQFKQNKKAWEFFQSQAPWYQRTAAYRIMSAKREETRISRLETLIKDSEEGKRIDDLSKWGAK